MSPFGATWRNLSLLDALLHNTGLTEVRHDDMRQAPCRSTACLGGTCPANRSGSVDPLGREWPREARQDRVKVPSTSHARFLHRRT